MKTFDELCAIMQRIATAPEQKVDYLTVGDFLQMRQHITICEPCDKLVDETIAKAPKEDSFNIGEAGVN